MSKKKKAQVAVEFVIFVALLLFVMLIFLAFILTYTADVRNDKDREMLKDIAYAIQAEVNIASAVDDGYERNFVVPLLIESTDYMINITQDQVWATTENAEIVLDVPEIVGNLTKGGNTIRKTDGIIYLNVGIENDTSLPEVTLIGPSDGSTDTDGDISFSYSVFDLESGISNCSLVFNGVINQTNTGIIESATQYFALINVSAGSYNWTVKCTDNSPQNNSGQPAAWDLDVQLLYNDPPTTPTLMSCDAGSCTASFIDPIDILCGGSTDVEGDNITYSIDAYYTENISESKTWQYIGNHTEITTFEWNITDIPAQTGIDLRCKAIDTNGSGIYSGYYDPSISLEIATIPETGSTINHDFNSSSTGWTGSDWDLDWFESNPSESYSGSGGDSGGRIYIDVPSGKYDEVGGYWEQSFDVTVNDPTNVTCNFGWSVVDYETTPNTFQAYVFVDTASGEPTIGQQIWASGEQTGTTVWVNESVDCVSKITSAGTYYYKLAMWVETNGGDNDGPYEITFDNAQLTWIE